MPRLPAAAHALVRRVVRPATRAACLALLATSVDAAAGPGRHLNEAPPEPAADATYLFYLHGGFLESHRDGAFNRKLGVAYELQAIVDTFVERGFVVISEIRAEGTRPPDYARTVTGQIRHLLARGVAPERITVAGHSKGGAIALLVASAAGSNRLRFVNLAGCGAGPVHGRQFRRFVERRGATVRGRLLSLYDAADTVAGSCTSLRDAGAPARITERVLRTGDGHGLFYRPDPAWVDEVAAFAGRSARGAKVAARP